MLGGGGGGNGGGAVAAWEEGWRHIMSAAMLP